LRPRGLASAYLWLSGFEEISYRLTPGYLRLGANEPVRQAPGGHRLHALLRAFTPFLLSCNFRTSQVPLFMRSTWVLVCWGNSVTGEHLPIRESTETESGIAQCDPGTVLNWIADFVVRNLCQDFIAVDSLREPACPPDRGSSLLPQAFFSWALASRTTTGGTYRGGPERCFGVPGGWSLNRKFDRAAYASQI
jgi:hypothetical protein